MTTTRVWLSNRPWVWPFAAAVLTWLVTVYVASGRGATATLSAAALLSVFYVVVGMGQMFVIASGNGNIDLSVPYTMTLAGYLSMGYMHGQNEGLLVGVLIGLLCGLVVGLLNISMIRGLRMPPIIATLAVGYIAQSAATKYSHGSVAKPSPILANYATAEVFGVPIMSITFVLVAIAVGILLARSTFGRSVLAYGQNARAAWLAGVKIQGTVTMCFVISGVFAGLAGVLIGAYAGGAALNIAIPYQLGSIAVVVLGGSSITGGKANVPGIWGAALFLTLLVNMLNAMGIGAAFRDIIQGLIIVAVLAIAGGESER
jgi:ribose transport system permease protein